MNQRQCFAFRHLIREFYIGFFERAPEAAHPIAILPYILAFRFIEDVANVCAGIAVGLDDADEILDQLLEKYVVFPERVVRVNHQSSSVNASSAMDAAALGWPKLLAASRILVNLAESFSSAAIFHAAAGKLLQRIAAPASSK